MVVWHYYIWMYLRLQGKSVMQILKIFDYIGFYNRIISRLVIVFREWLNQISAEGLKVLTSEMSLHSRWYFISSLHFLSTIYLGQLFLFAAVIYSTFSLHTVVYMSPVKCQLHSFFNLFSVIPSEKQILKLNELFFLSLCPYN